MKSYKYAIFDIDGTLIDSMSYWHNLGRNYLLSKGCIPRKDLNSIIDNLTMRQAAEYFINEYHIQSEAQEVISEINKMIENAYFNDIQLKTGAADYLQYLYNKGTVMCIATTTSRYLAEAACKRLGILKYFEFIISSDDIGVGKDKPDIYYKAITQMNGIKKDTVVYEDASYAIHTVIEAGIDCIAVYDKYSGEVPDSIKQKCVRVINSY